MLIILIVFKNFNNNFHKANVELVLQEKPFCTSLFGKGKFVVFPFHVRTR